MALKLVIKFSKVQKKQKVIIKKMAGTRGNVRCFIYLNHIFGKKNLVHFLKYILLKFGHNFFKFQKEKKKENEKMKLHAIHRDYRDDPNLFLFLFFKFKICQFLF